MNFNCKEIQMGFAEDFLKAETKVRLIAITFIILVVIYLFFLGRFPIEYAAFLIAVFIVVFFLWLNIYKKANSKK